MKSARKIPNLKGTKITIEAYDDGEGVYWKIVDLTGNRLDLGYESSADAEADAIERGMLPMKKIGNSLVPLVSIQYELPKFPKTVAPGTRFRSVRHGYLLIMAYVDGYYLWRYKGLFPAVSNRKDFQYVIDHLNESNRDDS